MPQPQLSNEDLIPQRAFLISVYKGNFRKEIAQEHLEELALLSETYGVYVVGKALCQLRKYDSAYLLTEGKLEEYVKEARDLNANLIIFDDEISPSQQRNLEKAFGISVIDRTGVILEVFAKRAQTKEARLQIELAKVKYEAPRLKRMWSHLSRQHGSGGSGSGGFQKGEGEKQIEIDRRILQRDIDQLQKELEEVKAIRNMQRSSRMRSEIPIFAIIGYTNAGKSTLLNALTDSNVFVEDKLFATLDTTTRRYHLPNNQEILLIDTVGFIRKLPHLLVAAFKGTLEEALHADVLLHLIDVSHPMAEEQAATSMEVLKELGAEKTPLITILNKIDQCPDPTMINRFRILYPKTICISALKREGFDELHEAIIYELSKQRKVVDLRIPQSEYAIVSELIRLGNIINQDYEENDILLRVDLPSHLAGKLSKYAKM